MLSHGSIWDPAGVHGRGIFGCCDTLVCGLVFFFNGSGFARSSALTTAGFGRSGVLAILTDQCLQAAALTDVAAALAAVIAVQCCCGVGGWLQQLWPYGGVVLLDVGGGSGGCWTQASIYINLLVYCV